MCGIAAIIGRPTRPNLKALTFAQIRRGPDCARHELVHPTVGLGHTRLRVVDPRPAADQPMSFADEQHLVFNGAITNHRSLRRELEQADPHIAFRTNGDTEVLLHALRIWGEAALPKLKGMFAFVFYDARRRRVIAARDRLGQKPLVWARCSNGSIFIASEARAILRACPELDAAIDSTALAQMLRFNHPLGDRTFWRSIHALEPGRLLLIDGIGDDRNHPTPVIRRWWTLPMTPAENHHDDVHTAPEELDTSFCQAIARVADIDVSHGTYLSGGIDSSGIAAELLRTNRKTTLYSLVLPNVEYSEEPHIDRTAEHFGVESNKVAVDTLTLDDIATYALRSEMPQWWTSDLALGKLAERAHARGTRVIFTGEGPDELFGGYEIYRVAPLRPLASRFGKLLSSRFFNPLHWLDIDSSVTTAYLRSHSLHRANEIQDHFGFHPENLALWEVLEARRPLRHSPNKEEERVHFRERLHMPRGLTNLEKNLYFETSERLSRWILHMGDRMSSTHGIELRFPYLDDDFVDLTTRLPMRFRSTMLEDKRVLRRMHRARLPRFITKRKKQPLYTPTAKWLTNIHTDKRLFADYWNKKVFDRVDLFDFDVCEEARKRLAANHVPDALTGMTDEWLFTFALTATILANNLS